MIFRKRYAKVPHGGKPEIKKDLWEKCGKCGKIVIEKRWKENLQICPHCGDYSRMSAPERISLLTDEGTFRELHNLLVSVDPLHFVGLKTYPDKLRESMTSTGLSEAMIAGEAKIGGFPVLITVLDARFMMGSMGSVVGEKFARACETAIEKKMPLISVSGGGGGARMQEGIISLMQMAKTSAAVGKINKAGLLYISILTDPTMGGVAASFALLGDIIIAEPKALIGFTGPRVIEQTIRQKVPAGFQRSEFLFEHGMIDLIIERSKLKSTIKQMLKIFH